MAFVRDVGILVFLVAFAVAYDDTGYEALDSVLHHYDTLHTQHINHSYTRATPSLQHRHVQFHTLGRHFHLNLVPNDRIFSRDFGAHVVGEDGQLRQVHLDKEEFYHGYLHGDDESTVTAHISKSGVMTASIITSSEIYHVEPSQHYISEPHPFHMIVYKRSHVKDRLRGCRMDYATGPALMTDHRSKLESEPVLKEKSNFHSSHFLPENRQNHLKKRQTSSTVRFPGGIAGSSCPMILVSDFTVFEEFGRDERGIMVQLVQLMDSIDRIIFRPSRWIVDTVNPPVAGLGIEIRNVTVHTASSDSSDVRTYYNRDIPSADASNLLNDMRFGAWDNYCLAHLFTNRNFASGLLGLANIASPLGGQTGGICSRSFSDFGFTPVRRVIYNTGVSTFNNNGQLMLMSELIRVTGHELGHNWGSHHDPPAEPGCGSRWLMNEFAQDGSEETHMQFSPCSLSSIGQVLLTKATCFDNPTRCGNFEIDAEEQCDAGPEGDACCDNQCHLVQGAICSDLNQPCCNDCLVADSTVVCRAVGRISVNCISNTTCNGVSLECPEVSPPAADGTACIGSSGGGVCMRNASASRSECVSFCALAGETKCTCGPPYECVICCNDTLGQCRPAVVDNGTLPLSNGAGCSNDNVCIDGQCTDTTQDLIERIWDIIVNLDINAFRRFVGENIVGFVLIFSIPLWCIGSCFVNCCIDHHGYQWILSKLSGVQEEVDANTWSRDVEDWFSHRIALYFSRLGNRYTRLPSVAEESDNENKNGSNEKLLQPVDPVDDSPPPNYTFIDS